MKATFINPRALLAALALLGTVQAVDARPTETLDGGQRNERRALLKTAAGCRDAEATIDLDINNVRARIMTGGDMWWDRGTSEARYEVPKGSRKNALYAGSLWVGGYDTQGQLKVTAQTFRQSGNDYWTGPLDANNAIEEATCTQWDRFWKVDRSDVIVFREMIARGQKEVVRTDATFASIREWPARGNTDALGSDGTVLQTLITAPTNLRSYAPFIDVNNNGIYDWEAGDYPSIDVREECGVTEIGGPDQYIFSIFNDVGNTKTQTSTDGIGLEVQRTAFAYSTKDYLNDATFYNYRLINRGALTLDSCHTATFSDADLGFATDDYVGCDTARGLGILYNQSSVDGSAGQINAYGDQVPMVGVDFFIGPKKFTTSPFTGRDTVYKLKMSKFTYFRNTGLGFPDEITDPTTGIQFFRYMTGTNKAGNPFTNDFTGVAGQPSKGYGQGPNNNFVFFGDPGIAGTWSECFSGNPAGDTRFIHSAGPFQLTGGGVTNDITIGVTWVSNTGGCPNTSFTKIKIADDVIQELFETCFRTIEGPEAPRVVIREMNNQLVFNLFNDSASTNFAEIYGSRERATALAFQLFPNNDTASQKRRLSYINRYLVSSTKSRGSSDSFYKFEGYRVFQLRDAQVQPAQIFGEDGELDQTVAAEVFQCDLRNGVSQIVNYAIRPELPNTPYAPQLKVTGRDSGIRHSFVLTEDAFSKTQDKKLINYKTYYYVAIAYAYNEFAQFNPANPATTQDRAYLESAKGVGGTPIEVYAVMPDPSNGDMGTTLNAAYGDGVQITRYEGIGNGANILNLSEASEAQALAPPYIAKAPVYAYGSGPVNVRIVDPLKVVEADWELRVSGALRAADRGINPDSGRWALINTTNPGAPIYSERNLRLTNEQILEDYGISIELAQAERPGDLPEEGNGYLTSDVTYEKRELSWLAGVQDEEDRNTLNWIRSGTFQPTEPDPRGCNFDDKEGIDDQQEYENMLANNTLTAGTWAPYALAVTESKSICGFGVAASFTSKGTLDDLRSVDVVFTADKTKWSRCVVVELQDTIGLSQGGAAKHTLRRAPGWNMDINGGAPVYSTAAADSSFSYFPGYAIDQETGERLNIFFGEDSYQRNENGRDMLWNPTSTSFDAFGNPVYGGKHYIFVTRRRYDECRSIASDLRSGARRTLPYQQTMWVGLPLVRTGVVLKSLTDGLIPTTTRLRFRVTRPYAAFVSDSTRVPTNNNLPVFGFSTRGMGPRAYDANSGRGKGLLDSIYAVPNPYYGYTGYEQNRLDTRVRITRLPRNATLSIYSLDGSLVRRLTKDDPNTSHVDWDMRNARGLPVASGMYLIHVNAQGIGETVIKWFGAMRPLDVTSF